MKGAALLTKFSRALAALTLAALAFTVTACGSEPAQTSTPENKTVTVRMGTQPWLGYGQWYVAEEKKFYGDHLQVDLASFNADAEVNAALAAGRLDVANVGAQAALQFIEQGLDLSIVLMLNSSTTADAIVAGADVKSVKDLKGKKIAFEKGATSEILLAEALRANGLKPEDVETVETDADQVAPVLLAGHVDAGVTYEPYVSEALNSGDKLQAIQTAGDFPGLITDVLVVRNEFLKKNPVSMKQLLAAWGEAVNFYQEHETQAQKIIAAGVGSAATELETAFKGVHFYTLAENREQLAGVYQNEALPALAEVAERVGLIKGEIDIASRIDPKPLER